MGLVELVFPMGKEMGLAELFLPTGNIGVDVAELLAPTLDFLSGTGSCPHPPHG